MHTLVYLPLHLFFHDCFQHRHYYQFLYTKHTPRVLAIRCCQNLHVQSMYCICTRCTHPYSQYYGSYTNARFYIAYICMPSAPTHSFASRATSSRQCDTEIAVRCEGFCLLFKFAKIAYSSPLGSLKKTRYCILH